MLSLYAFGKWAVAALAILGFYRAISVIVREAGNPDLTVSARKQILRVPLICTVPVLATVWLVSSSGEEASRPAAHPAQAQVAPAETGLPSVSETSTSLAAVAESGSTPASGASAHSAQSLRHANR